jgi:hypothetical protein
MGFVINLHVILLISVINPSLEIGYCSTLLSNHDIIRLVRFVSKIKVGVVK